MPRAPSARALELTGIILTKADGDARGGAALSVRYVTGKPIVFLGSGEKLEALQPFDPERMASRILGMGDVVSLVEEVQRKVDVDGGREARAQGGQRQGLQPAGSALAARAGAQARRPDRGHGQAADAAGAAGPRCRAIRPIASSSARSPSSTR